MTGVPATNVAAVLTHARSNEPRLGGGRLICVDGPAGSGKTTLGEALHAAAPGSVLLHMDDFYEGWDGLGQVANRLVDGLIAPLVAGRPGRLRTWDWHASRWGHDLVVPVADLLVLEGVGSGSSSYADRITTLVWVDAPAHLRRERGLARDGEAFAPHWERWAAQEAEVFAREATRSRAHLRVDAQGRLAALS